MVSIEEPKETDTEQGKEPSPDKKKEAITFDLVKKYIAEGWVLRRVKAGKWFLYKGKEAPKYVPVGVVREHIDFFTGAASEEIYRIVPDDLILHDTARRLLDSIVTLERLYMIPKEDRADFVFACRLPDGEIDDKMGARGSTASNHRLSLPDISVYHLIDVYLKYQKADETIKRLEEENYVMFQKINSVEFKMAQLKNHVVSNVLMGKMLK